MPVFEYECEPCGYAKERLVSNADERVTCAGCAGTMVRLFSPTTNLRLAPYMAREAEDGRAAHRAWMESDETKAKLKSGEYDVDLSDRHCESGNGKGASSSVLARLESGVPLA